MDNVESVIWDTITKSARIKFDSDYFENYFLGSNKHHSDSILYILINGYAAGESEAEITTKIMNKLNKVGSNFDPRALLVFLSNKEKLLREEIYAAAIVSNMYKEHNEPVTILNTINRMLN